jgi:hypothetical protein
MGVLRGYVPRPARASGGLSLLQRLGPVTKLSFAQKKRTRLMCRGELGNKSVEGVGDVQSKKGAERGT